MPRAKLLENTQRSQCASRAQLQRRPYQKRLGRSPTRTFPTQRTTETPQGAAHQSHTPNGAGSTSAFRVLHAFLYLPSLRPNLQPQRASAALAADPGYGPRQHTRRQLSRDFAAE